MDHITFDNTRLGGQVTHFQHSKFACERLLDEHSRSTHEAHAQQVENLDIDGLMKELRDSVLEEKHHELSEEMLKINQERALLEAEKAKIEQERSLINTEKAELLKMKGESTK